MENKPSEISSSKMFGGYNKRYKHFSPTLGCSMTFTIYFPPSSSPCHKFPVLYWLSGLTCNDENFITKSGAQRAAAEEGLALIAPDTSPRGLSIEGEAESWDFGVGAGFYLNATQEKWKNWRMYDYVVKELPKLLNENFPLLDTLQASISGHSMGGHGALTIYLKNLEKYKSVSAFAPIVNSTNCLPRPLFVVNLCDGGGYIDQRLHITYIGISLSKQNQITQQKHPRRQPPSTSPTPLELDAYYITPEGKKVRFQNEIAAFLKGNPKYNVLSASDCDISSPKLQLQRDKIRLVLAWYCSLLFVHHILLSRRRRSYCHYCLTALHP